jgi:general secretion pathway protein E
MNFLDDEKYLLDLLTRKNLLTPEQKKAFSMKKEAQRQLLLRKIGGRRPDERRRASLNQPDVVDIIVSLQFQIPGKKAQVLSEDIIMQAVAKDLKMPFKKLDPLELDLDLVTKTIPKSLSTCCCLSASRTESTKLPYMSLPKGRPWRILSGPTR